MASLIVVGGFSLVLVLKIGFTLLREDDNYSTTSELLVGQNYLSYSFMENSVEKEGLNSTNLPIKFVEKDGDSDERSAVEDLEVISVRRIWGINNHNAFTSLVEHNGVLYCAFRHATDHNSRDGKIQVIKSNDGGSNWVNEAIFSLDGKDLRDPKLSINSKGDIVLIVLSRSSNKERNKHVTHIWRLVNDKWTASNLVSNFEDTWKWGVARIGDQIYSIAYSGKDKFGTLYNSDDGQNWEKVADKIFPDIGDYPNESAFVELDDKSILCLLRKNKGRKNAKLGVSKPPYKKWVWKDLNQQIGGPSLIKLPNGDIYACVRLYGPVRTSICKVNRNTGQLEEIVKLPSGNDTSYAGMILFDGILYVSYYSNHETDKGKSAIYLAKIKI